MTVYSVDKLISEARRLAADYRRATGKTMPGVSIEIAQNDAARLLDLELANDPQLGYDALGRQVLKKATGQLDTTPVTTSHVA